MAAAEGLHFVPSFHRDLVIGVSRRTPSNYSAAARGLDAVYVGVGMGSGINGLIAVRDLMGLKTEIMAVGAAKAPATARSFAAGTPSTPTSARTFADGLATREPNAQASRRFAGVRRAWWKSARMRSPRRCASILTTPIMIVEGAGAAPLAALLQERARMAGKNVAVVLSGGNIERARYLQVLSGLTPPAK